MDGLFFIKIRALNIFILEFKIYTNLELVEFNITIGVVKTTINVSYVAASI
jgi:hypothetical protein